MKLKANIFKFYFYKFNIKNKKKIKLNFILYKKKFAILFKQSKIEK